MKCKGSAPLVTGKGLYLHLSETDLRIYHIHFVFFFGAMINLDSVVNETSDIYLLQICETVTTEGYNF